MPDLNFQIIGVKAAVNGLTPLVQFELSVSDAIPGNHIQSVLLRAQIQIQSPQRSYNPSEKSKLIDLFGTPERWGQTLRNRLWASTDTTIGPFTGKMDATLTVPCTFDLAIASTKYFYALEEGEVPLLFLFSGTVFYQAEDGQLQVQPISWNKESAFRLPICTWRETVERLFPNTGWLTLRRDVFDRLYTLKRYHGDATWEQTIARLLPEPAADLGTAA